MCYFKADEEISDSERRVLAQKPELSAERVFSGEYAKEFEVYAADQFPMRDNFRTVKAVFSTKILNKADNNGIYMKEGHISKLEYPENKEMMEYGAKKFTSIYHKFIKNSDADVYLSIVPDKNYFLAEKYGYPSINYENFIDYFESEMNYAVYIDIAQLLEIDDYYRTDSHWKQEKITGIAKYMAEQMGADEIRLEYTVNKLDNPFLGVYAGQSALPCEADEIKYLTNDIIDNAVVTYYDTGMPKEGAMYDMEKAKGKDPYEMFLSGSTPLVTIENPAATTERELVIFRDSFGSSIAPLLSQRYKKTTVVDIRYVQSDYLGAFIKFNNQDVLFLYSTTMLNNSKILR
ncbi:MAG: hypothetical protein E7415_04415 [Ruminococcaceae bacterium]|nr:hypothetical protein [Oscillospiraceae bacterium]